MQKATTCFRTTCLCKSFISSDLFLSMIISILTSRPCLLDFILYKELKSKIYEYNRESDKVRLRRKSNLSECMWRFCSKIFFWGCLIFFLILIWRLSIFFYYSTGRPRKYFKESQFIQCLTDGAETKHVNKKRNKLPAFLIAVCYLDPSQQSAADFANSFLKSVGQELQGSSDNHYGHESQGIYMHI